MDEKVLVEGVDGELVSCWQCGGEGDLGSACVDDMCHGNETCIHGDDMGWITCDICKGAGEFVVPWEEIDRDLGEPEAAS